MEANRAPSNRCKGMVLGESAIQSPATTSAINTGSDQAIEYMLRSEGLKAMMESVKIANCFRTFAFFKINIAKKVDIPALAVLISTKVVEGTSPNQSPKHISAETPGGRTVICSPTTSRTPPPLAMFRPTAM